MSCHVMSWRKGVLKNWYPKLGIYAVDFVKYLDILVGAETIRKGECGLFDTDSSFI